MNTNANAATLDLRMLRPEAGFVRMELVGRLSRDAWPANYDPFVQLYGNDVYASKVLINMNKTSYMDSSGVGWLLSANKQFKENGGTLVLHTLTPMTAQLLKMMRIDQVLHVAADETSARRKLEGDVHA
jgi:anti-anti-sigma factor